MFATKAQRTAHLDAAELPTLDSGVVKEEASVGSHADVPDELTGKVLNGTYCVEGMLGQGGMGCVYEARHTRIAQKRVAVKVLHHEFGRNRDALARFQREAEAAASISHPNVVAVLDVDRTPSGMPYLVCEHLQGIDLAEHLKQVGKLDLALAVHVAKQICQGLAAAHARGVVHRDLKPQNIFLIGDDETGIPAHPLVKILDFGLSRIVHADAELTRTGIIVGTPAFMPPEQALGCKADHRADVYGVGAILYKALTGHAPYEHDTAQAAVAAVLKGEPPTRVRALEPSLPVQVELVIERAMARDPAQRYENVSELARALEALDATQLASDGSAPVRGLPTGGTAPSLRVMEAHGARSRLVLWLLAAALALTCLSAVAITCVEHVMDMRLSRLELGLSLGIVLGGLLVSGVLLVGGIRRSVWTSTSRVVLAAGHARASLFAAASVLGFGRLALHLVDDFVLRFVGGRQLAPLDVAWPGWNLILILVALIAAGTTLARRKLLLDAPRTWRRVVSGWVALALGLALSGGVVYGGLWLRQTLKWSRADSAQLPPAAS